MVNQVSCKLTNCLLVYAEKHGFSLSSLFEFFDGPEEFLRDPHFWLNLETAERFFTRAARVIGDPTLGWTVGSHAYELGAMGALDNVFKMMPTRRDYYNNLERFFTYFLAPVDNFREVEHGDTYVRFAFPFDGREYHHLFNFLRGLLETLPKFAGHPSAQTEYDAQKNSLFVTWEMAQSSLFDVEPAQVINPRLLQTLSAQIEASERALHSKAREVMSLRAELDQVRLELQTQLREKIYAEKMSGLAQLAAGVAHEINNPLSFVSSNLLRFQEYFERMTQYAHELEKRNPALAAEFKQRLDIDFIVHETPSMLKEAGEGVKRVKEIVKDLSALAHPQSGRSENRISTDLNSLLESSLKVFEEEIDDRIRVEKRFELRAPVQVFPVRMSQVFMNLISNAVHAIPRDGRIEIHTWSENKKAFVEIADTGVGMDDSVMHRIFTPFFTTKEVGKGTGLGLSIAQSIIEMHKGRIDVKSEKGKGSRFKITLPLEPSTATT